MTPDHMAECCQRYLASLHIEFKLILVPMHLEIFCNWQIFHTSLFSYMTLYWITTILNSRRWGLDHLLLWSRAQIYCMNKIVLVKTREKAELLWATPKLVSSQSLSWRQITATRVSAGQTLLTLKAIQNWGAWPARRGSSGTISERSGRCTEHHICNEGDHEHQIGES